MTLYTRALSTERDIPESMTPPFSSQLSSSYLFLIGLESSHLFPCVFVLFHFLIEFSFF